MNETATLLTCPKPTSPGARDFRSALLSYSCQLVKAFPSSSTDVKPTLLSPSSASVLVLSLSLSPDIDVSTFLSEEDIKLSSGFPSSRLYLPQTRPHPAGSWNSAPLPTLPVSSIHEETAIQQHILSYCLHPAVCHGGTLCYSPEH